MPRYVYRCNNCEEEFQRTHSMSEKLTDCELCNESDVLVRLPGTFIVFSNQKTSPVGRPGDIVDSFIEDTKKEVQDEKNRLKQKEYSQ